MKRLSPPLGLTALGVVCALGNDKVTIAKHAWAGDTSGMRLMEGILPNGDQTLFGWVDLPEDFEPTLSTRCERLLAAAYAQIKEAF
ncbi:MAG: beta-ketoacyl-[acyl-carrier-protein] synthase II, partial [bacterium]|nr:beta-ketoacyl-[acyl-carrier-protein] synthase II [bacterium]